MSYICQHGKYNGDDEACGYCRNEERNEAFLRGHDKLATVEAERDALRSQLSTAVEALKTAERCLEHVINRPHEHNPVGPFQRVACEIITDAMDAVRVALANQKKGTP